MAVDDYSRLAYAEVRPANRRGDALTFLERALAWLRAQGISVQAVVPDKGSAFRSAAWRRQCMARGLRHLGTRPYSPRTNGRAERCLQILVHTWAYAFANPANAHRTGRSSAGRGGTTGGVPTARWVASRPSAVSHTSVFSTPRRQ